MWTLRAVRWWYDNQCLDNYSDMVSLTTLNLYTLFPLLLQLMSAVPMSRFYPRHLKLVVRMVIIQIVRLVNECTFVLTPSYVVFLIHLWLLSSKLATSSQFINWWSKWCCQLPTHVDQDHNSQIVRVCYLWQIVPRNSLIPYCRVIFFNCWEC